MCLTLANGNSRYLHSNPWNEESSHFIEEKTEARRSMAWGRDVTGTQLVQPRPALQFLPLPPQDPLLGVSRSLHPFLMFSSCLSPVVLWSEGSPSMACVGSVEPQDWPGMTGATTERGHCVR